MKKLLFIIVEDNEHTSKLLHELASNDFNGTVIPTTSLKHILHSENADTPLFITLNMLSKNHAFEENTTIISVIDEEKINGIKELVNRVTENFNSIRGGMFVLPLESYEGSF